MLPKTIGSFNQFKGHKSHGSHFALGTFGLATLVDAETAVNWDEHDRIVKSGHDDYPMKTQIVITHDITVTRDQNNNRRGVKEGSEDGMMPRSSAEIYSKELATPRSFLNDNH